MPKYTLHYLNVRGRGEIIRFIFHYAGVDFEDKRYSMPEAKEVMANEALIPFGLLPVLEIDGKLLPQSMAIARYLAAEFDLLPKDNFERALCDSIMDTIADLGNFYGHHVFREPDETKKEEMKKKFLEEIVPATLRKLETFCAANKPEKGFLVGNTLTWADLMVVCVGDNYKEGKCFDELPILKDVYEKASNIPKILEYRNNRPETPF